MDEILHDTIQFITTSLDEKFRDIMYFITRTRYFAIQYNLYDTMNKVSRNFLLH